MTGMIPMGAKLIIRTVEYRVIRDIVREGSPAHILRSRCFCIYPREEHYHASKLLPVPQLHTENPANDSIHAHHMVQRSSPVYPIFQYQGSIMMDRDSLAVGVRLKRDTLMQPGWKRWQPRSARLGAGHQRSCSNGRDGEYGTR